MAALHKCRPSVAEDTRQQQLFGGYCWPFAIELLQKRILSAQNALDAARKGLVCIVLELIRSFEIGKSIRCWRVILVSSRLPFNNSAKLSGERLKRDML